MPNIRLENIFQYTINTTVDYKFKTICYLLNMEPATTTAQHIQAISNTLKIEFTSDIKRHMTQVINDMAKGTIAESIMTLDTPLGGIQLILLAFELSSTTEYEKRTKLRETGGHIYYSLKKNDMRNINLVLDDPYAITYIIDGFLINMYAGASKKELTSKPPNNYAMNIVTGTKNISGVKKSIAERIVLAKGLYLAKDLRKYKDNTELIQYIKNLAGNMDLPIKIADHSASGHILTYSGPGNSNKNICLVANDYNAVLPALITILSCAKLRVNVNLVVITGTVAPKQVLAPNPTTKVALRLVGNNDTIALETVAKQFPDYLIMLLSITESNTINATTKGTSRLANMIDKIISIGKNEGIIISKLKAPLEKTGIKYIDLHISGELSTFLLINVMLDA